MSERRPGSRKQDGDPQDASHEQGATLIAAVLLIAVLALAAAAILSYVSQSYQSAAFDRHRTQALYNARMGVDAAAALIVKDANAVNLRSDSAHSRLQAAVEGDLAELELKAPPFADVVTVGRPVGGAMSVTLQATGVSGHGAVTLTESGRIQLPASGTGGGARQVASLTIVSHLKDISSLSVSNTGATPVSATGENDGGSITVNGASAVVSRFSRLNVVSAVYSNSQVIPPDTATAWIQGDHDTVAGSAARTVVITGTGDTLRLLSARTIVVTGSGAAVDSHGIGTVLLLGNNDSLNGPITCGGIVTGNGDVLSGSPVYGNSGNENSGKQNSNDGNSSKSSGKGSSGEDRSKKMPYIKGPLVVTGNNVVIGSPQWPVRIHGELVLAGNGFTLYGDVSNSHKKAVAVLATGQNEMIHGSVYGNIVENNSDLTVTGPVQGATTPFPGGQSVTVAGHCLGAISLNFAAATHFARLALNFSSAYLTG